MGDRVKILIHQTCVSVTARPRHMHVIFSPVKIILGQVGSFPTLPQHCTVELIDTYVHTFNIRIWPPRNTWQHWYYNTNWLSWSSD